ncbi:histidine decarboxylase isoform X1 [Lucilia sericata]|uniref:histidine decarboxylase isoform X1 n=2 Tax=Lucilia sericata TaxID=13632 RepID=UPI0018A8435C|nr:histidine decarboxylase isoform X1 [Lucilia sericata]XP_037808179.1 histidine decarboxylase isoform X1 [Lucilia sericata]
MDFTEYRQRGKEMVDYIADYLENIRDRRVFPDVKPGYMKNLLPDSAPLEGEQWDAIFGDVERVIMPGITHWQSPHMHAYFPALNSFPSLLGDMLADAINCLGFTWASSPACTELEIIVMNWLGKMINLPDEFLHLSSASRGGGVVQTTASEATLVCLLAGRTRAIQRFHEKRPGYQDAEINARLVAYCSDQAHSSVEKAALIGLVRMRYIEADENLSMRGQLLREAIEDDIRQGLVPFWVCATLGTTGSCSFDNLEEIGIVCREFNLWLHVDAAYAGSAFICPEFRTWLKGIERADSIAFNPSKWLMIHFDATALWVKDSTAVHRTFNVEPLYLQHENSGVAVDFMHWQIPLSRRFRALKIWFVLRSFGIKGLQRHIREGVRLAQKFEALVLADHRFEIPAKRHLGLVVFRIKGENEITERLLKRLNHRGNLHCIPSSLKGKYVIRFTVTSTRTSVDDILKDWMEIKNAATAILEEMNITISNRVYLKDTKEKCEGFGSSLLLSNSPLSPKIVNGSFAALFDADEFLAKTYAGIRIAHQESPSMRRRVRGILMSGKQFSLDSHMDVVVQTSMNSHTTNSRMVDCYGKTSASSKNEERDSICEDEESLEDCEMNWLLNTTLQLNPKSYLAVLNKHQKLTPIDIIHHQNNLSLLTRYAKRYEVNNFTKSVNSVRTPLTQYQLYTRPRRPPPLNTELSKDLSEKQTDLTNLYPGKRYLNLDLTPHNDSIFTDTIFNLPTPTEDLIPIIITADTPTSSTNSVPEIEDLNKLHPPNSSFIAMLESDNEVEDLKKLLPSTSILIPIEEMAEETKDIEESLVSNINTITKEDLREDKAANSSSFSNLMYSEDNQDKIEDLTPINMNPFLMQIYPTIVKDSSHDQELKYPSIEEDSSVFKATNTESNMQPPISSNKAEDLQLFKDINKDDNPSCSKDLRNEIITKLPKGSTKDEDSSVFGQLSNESSYEPSKSVSNFEDPFDLKELNRKLNIQSSKSSSITENSLGFKDLNISLNQSMDFLIDSAKSSLVFKDSSDLEELNPGTSKSLSFTECTSELNKNLRQSKDSSFIEGINNEGNNQQANDANLNEDSSLSKQSSTENSNLSSNNKPSNFYSDIKKTSMSNESDKQSPKSSDVVKDLTGSKETGNNIQSSTYTDVMEDSSVFKELSNESNIKTLKTTLVLESYTDLKELPNESNNPKAKCSTQSDNFPNFKNFSKEFALEPTTSSTFVENTSNFKAFNTKSYTNEDVSLFKPLTKDNSIQSLKSSSPLEDFSDFKDCESSNQSSKSSSALEVATVFKELNKEKHKPTKILNSKSKDDSSSSDEFLQSARQPSNYSEDSSSESSSLELM